MKTILICDDEPHVREGLRYLLRGPGRTIIALPSAAEALKRIKADPIDLLITDVMMPEMSGLELVAQLRSQIATSNLPILIVTARGQPQDATIAREVWGAHVIAKPFDPRAVKELVASILGEPICVHHGCT